MKKWIVVIVLVAAAVAGTVYVRRAKPVEASSTLITSPVMRGDVVESVQATGALEAVTTVQVGTQVSGTIKSLHADFNSRVRAGQVVARLEESAFQAQLEQATATLTRLQADRDRARIQVEDVQIKLRRARELSARQLLPASELDTAESNARQADAALKSAEAQIVQARASLNQSQVNLGYTVIKAPIDGVVVSRNVDVGQTVAASMQAPILFVIAKDLAEMQVSAAIDESDIGRIRAGQAVTFRVDAYPDDTFTGTVKQVRLQPVVTQNVVSYTTIISVPNPSLRLKPGMTATVTVEIARADNVLRVPGGAVRFRPTPELFASLGQAPPAGFGTAGPGARGGDRQVDRGPGVGTGDSGGAPAALQGTAPQRPRTAGGQPAGGGTPAAGGAPSDDARASRRERAGDGEAARAGQDGVRTGSRFANMSAEERQRMREARRAGAGDPATAPGAGNRTQANRAGAPEEEPAAEAPKITTRPVWVLRDGQLARVIVRVSVSDGAAMAVVDGALAEGDLVVTGVAQPAQAQQGTGNPLMPFGGRAPGGFGGNSNRNTGGGAGGGVRR